MPYVLFVRCFDASERCGKQLRYLVRFNSIVDELAQAAVQERHHVEWLPADSRQAPIQYLHDVRMVGVRAEPKLVGKAITSRTKKVDFGKYLHRKRPVVIATNFPNRPVSTLSDPCVGLIGVKHRSVFGDPRVEE